MNQKETICPYAPTYHIHDLLLECGRDACFYEITFPVAAALRSIFCHNVYSQSSITANNMGLNELLAILLSVCVLGSHIPSTSIQDTHTHTHTLHTHTIRLPVVPVIMCGMNTTCCESTLDIYRETRRPPLFCLRTMAMLQC